MFRGTTMPGNSTRCTTPLRGDYLWVTAQRKESWENLTTKIPAADSGGCTRLCEPFQPSTCNIFKYFPREHEFNYLVPVSAQTTETSSGFINSTLFFLTEGVVNDQIKLRFKFAPIMQDTDPCQGNQLHYSTSYTDVTLPCSNCVPEF